MKHDGLIALLLFLVITSLINAIRPSEEERLKYMSLERRVTELDYRTGQLDLRLKRTELALAKK